MVNQGTDDLLKSVDPQVVLTEIQGFYLEERHQDQLTKLIDVDDKIGVREVKVLYCILEHVLFQKGQIFQ